MWVDGIQQEDLLINDKYVASHNLIIASGLKFGTHTFKIIRATEATVARKFYLCGVVLDGNLLNVSQKQRPYIEVYGDSISSGYGNISSREYTAFNKDDSNYVFVKDGYLVDRPELARTAQFSYLAGLCEEYMGNLDTADELINKAYSINTELQFAGFYGKKIK